MEKKSKIKKIIEKIVNLSATDPAFFVWDDLSML
jgi:hypothetical protein